MGLDGAHSVGWSMPPASREDVTVSACERACARARERRRPNGGMAWQPYSGPHGRPSRKEAAARRRHNRLSNLRSSVELGFIQAYGKWTAAAPASVGERAAQDV